MAEETFEMFVQRERSRLQGEREAVLAQQQELENKLAGLSRELAAIDAYEAAKSGKPIQGTRKAGGTGARPQARRGSRRETLLKMISDNPSGLTRGQILERMGLKGNRAGEMSVSNALTALTRANQLSRRDRKYVPAA
jgi:hypothetical protein